MFTARLRQLKNALVAMVMIACTATAAHAQTEGQIHINIQPKSEILPPQVGQYKDNVGKLFMVSVTNIGAQEQYVYFGMQLEYLTDAQGMPVANLKVSTPVDRPTATPYVITLAPVCRPTWLIEMECVAIRSHSNPEYHDF